MKRIATVTFHRAHNFGSVLQTYALQEYIINLCHENGEKVEYKVVDLFTENQEQLYSVYKKNNSLKNIFKNLIAFPFSRDLKLKHKKFELFLNEYIYLTERYKTSNELKKNPPEADFFISGSDQIWNVRAKDFSSSYYLDFVKSGKKISYAASFGPLNIKWEKYDYANIQNLLKEYKYISVRENGSAENVEKLTGSSCPVNIDPTLLLDKEEWRKIQSSTNYRNGKYILLYCLEPTKEQLKIANMISSRLKLPILVLRYNNKNDMFNRYVKRYNSGPKDFLSYIDHAELVLTSSFHGTVFSLIYNKPFYVFNGMGDNRISTILTKTDMCLRALNCMDDIEKVNLQIPDEKKIKRFLENERIKSEIYLRESLELA